MSIFLGTNNLKDSQKGNLLQKLLSNKRKNKTGNSLDFNNSNNTQFSNYLTNVIKTAAKEKKDNAIRFSLGEEKEPKTCRRNRSIAPTRTELLDKINNFKEPQSARKDNEKKSFILNELNKRCSENRQKLSLIKQSLIPNKSYNVNIPLDSSKVYFNTKTNPKEKNKAFNIFRDLLKNQVKISNQPIQISGILSYNNPNKDPMNVPNGSNERQKDSLKSEKFQLKHRNQFKSLEFLTEEIGKDNDLKEKFKRKIFGSEENKEEIQKEKLRSTADSRMKMRISLTEV